MAREDDAKDKAEGKLDHAVGRAKDIAEDVRDAAGQLIERAREEIESREPEVKLDHAVAKAKDIAEEVRDAAGHLIERAREEIVERLASPRSDARDDHDAAPSGRGDPVERRPAVGGEPSGARPAMRTRKTKADVWTIPHGDGWANQREGAKRVAKVFPTKAAAQTAGRITAQREKVEHIVFKRDGEIGERNSYSTDHVRRKG